MISAYNTAGNGGRWAGANSAHQRTARSQIPHANTGSVGASHRRSLSRSASAASSSATPFSAR